MSIYTDNNIQEQSSVQKNPNYNAMMQDYNQLTAEYQILVANLNPPNEAKIRDALDQMLKTATQMNADANRDVAITPTIGMAIDSIENAISLLNAGDISGIQQLLTSPSSDFQQARNTIRNFILYPSTQPVPQAPNDQDLLNQLGLLQGYLEEFQKDLSEVPPNMNDADRIYGYVITAAADLWKDAPDAPSISPIIGALLGTVDNMRALFLSSPPDIKGCLAILKDGSLEEQMSQIYSLILAQEAHS